ncbi:hypothetical protein [Paenibacillus sp. MMS20-IR301]|uniref:hypothetical protein n=1 Tax=Paenibacillus sp. MMS20-IR301 TaxID=2895946 RepID=UPI0028E4B895|nr:hypothetical protein [Paenibacillus sp. MMS20-IR301]WNS41957.1 hypothetical protein LOS79_23520 [Paenibacillus sp. MMS20-IR301]
MNPAPKTNGTPEGYRPAVKPDIISSVEKKAENRFQSYKNIEYRMDIIEYPESLKLAGVPISSYPNFANIDHYHAHYKAQMMDRCAPYTEVGFSGGNAEHYDYFFGCQVKSLDDLPEGLAGIDTGLTKFASITFRASSAEELVGGNEGAGNGMKSAQAYIKEIWLPGHRDEVAPIADWDSTCFEIKISDRIHYMNMIEVYKVELNVDAEMCYYLPLRQQVTGADQ